MRSTLLLLTICFALFLSLDSFAAPGRHKKALIRMTFGAKVGLHMQELDGGRTYESAYKPGITGGVFLSVNRYKHGIRVEGLLHTARFNSYHGDSHINTLAVDIPVLYEVKIIDRLWLQFGPQFTNLISAKSSGAGGNRVDVKNRFRNADISAVLGLEVTASRRIVVGARYIYGFIDENNTSFVTATPESWRNKSIEFYLGYRFY
jgi:hypothetical protein